MNDLRVLPALDVRRVVPSGDLDESASSLISAFVNTHHWALLKELESSHIW